MPLSLSSAASFTNARTHLSNHIRARALWRRCTIQARREYHGRGRASAALACGDRKGAMALQYLIHFFTYTLNLAHTQSYLTRP
jgi:hypothetical protein